VCVCHKSTWYQMIDDLERIGNKADVVSEGTILEFAWRDCRKQPKTSARMTCGTVEFRTKQLQNTSHECYHHTNLLGARTHLPLPFIHNQHLLRVRGVRGSSVGPETSYHEVLRGFPQYL
jgi:hypothetical protein